MHLHTQETCLRPAARGRWRTFACFRPRPRQRANRLLTARQLAVGQHHQQSTVHEQQVQADPLGYHILEARHRCRLLNTALAPAAQASATFNEAFIMNSLVFDPKGLEPKVQVSGPVRGDGGMARGGG